MGAEHPSPIFLDKSCNLSKIVSVLLSASVERFFVSRMRDFFVGIGKSRDRQKVGFTHSVSPEVDGGEGGSDE